MDNKLSIIIPVWNEENNIKELVKQIDNSLLKNRITYEIIFVDDDSNDKTKEEIKSLINDFPVKLFSKIGKKGKAYSLLEGFSYAKHDIVCMIDADLQ